MIRTFIMSNKVFRTIRVMIKYSNVEETTNFHTLCLRLVLLLGIYLSIGRASIVKSIHDFCKCIYAIKIELSNLERFFFLIDIMFLVTEYIVDRNRILINYFYLVK